MVARREYLYIQMKRREEKDIIWHIIRYIKTLESLHCYIDDLRTFEKCKNDYEYAYNQLRSKNISAKSIQVAIRYCQLQYHQGLCDYQITRDNIKLIKDWENYTPDYYSRHHPRFCVNEKTGILKSSVFLLFIPL